MIEADVEIRFLIEGPFLCRSSSVGAYGVDAVPLRNPDGGPVLPGTQVRGRMREALEMLAEACETSASIGTEAVLSRSEVERWFGPEVEANVAEIRSRPFAWRFGEFSTTDVGSSDGTLTRIAIDDTTGSARSGSLLVIEPAVAVGQQTAFAGTVQLFAESAASMRRTFQALRSAASWTASFGSFRNVGFGAVRSATAEILTVRSWNSGDDVAGIANTLGIEAERVRANSGKPLDETVDPTPRPAGRATATDERRALIVEMKEPFCVGGIRRVPNLFESTTFLSGAVLKGAVAQRLRRMLAAFPAEVSNDDVTFDDAKFEMAPFPVVRKWFAHIRFCAAFPAIATREVRPSVQPLSKFLRGEDTLDAAWLEDDAILLGESAIKFAPDDKGSDIEWANRRDEPRKELRIRTAMDSPSRRARDGFLFAQELVHPVTKKGEPLRWLATVDLATCEPTEKEREAHDPAKDVPMREFSPDVRKALWNELETLFGLSNFTIGKTKAPATFCLARSLPFDDHFLAQSERWILTLQSPALLLDGTTLSERWKEGVDASDELYRRAFLELSGQSLGPVRRFTRETLQGGFLAGRLRTGSDDYRPYVVTEPGSVFVLEAVSGRSEEAREILDAWIRRGIGQPKAVSRGPDYFSNPFLPQDGFGEVTIEACPRRSEKEEELEHGRRR